MLIVFLTRKIRWTFLSPVELNVHKTKFKTWMHSGEKNEWNMDAKRLQSLETNFIVFRNKLLKNILSTLEDKKEKWPHGNNRDFAAPSHKCMLGKKLWQQKKSIKNRHKGSCSQQRNIQLMRMCMCVHQTTPTGRWDDRKTGRQDKRPFTPGVPIHGRLSPDRQHTHRDRGRSQSGNQPIKTREGRVFGEKGRGLRTSWLLEAASAKLHKQTQQQLNKRTEGNVLRWKDVLHVLLTGIFKPAELR